jgi:hypothetical protein
MITSKQEAMNLFEQKRHEFLTAARWEAIRIWKRKGNITVDDVRAEVSTPSDINPTVWGALFNNSDWECVGYVKTTRQQAHGRPVGCWKYVGAKPIYNLTDNGQVSFI